MNQNTQKGKAKLSLQEAEKLAQRVEKEFGAVCTTLRDLKPQIEQIRDAFKEHCKGSVTIAGCRSFPEYCEKKLRRSKQAVYAMLGEYSKKKKRGDSDEEKKPRPQQPATHQKPVLADEDVARMRTGCNAAVRHFEAEAKGDKAEAEKAKKEFLEISKAESLKSVIFGDQPNYKALLIDLLSDVEKVGEKLPVSLTRKCQAIRKRLGIDDKSFGLTPEDRMQPKPEQQPKAAEPEAANANAQAKAPVAEAKQAKAKTNGNGKAEFLPTVVNGLHIVRRKDCKFVVFDPARDKNNTLAICDEIEQAVAAAQKKKPEQAQSAQADSAGA